MYLVTRKYHSGELMDALSERETEVRGIIAAVSGFKAYYFVRTAEGGMTITVCETHAGVQESSRRSAEWLRDNLPGLAMTAPEITEGEVIFSF